MKTLRSNSSSSQSNSRPSTPKRSFPRLARFDDSGSFVPRHASTPSSPSASAQNISANFRVMIRVRPPLPREYRVFETADIDGSVVQSPLVALIAVELSSSLRTLVLHESQEWTVRGTDPEGAANHSWTFDRIFDPTTNQAAVYDVAARDLVLSTLQVSFFGLGDCHALHHLLLPLSSAGL